MPRKRKPMRTKLQKIAGLTGVHPDEIERLIKEQVRTKRRLAMVAEQRSSGA